MLTTMVVVVQLACYAFVDEGSICGWMINQKGTPKRGKVTSD
jgi:hypothetical protein